MFVSDDLIFIELHKTGSSHIVKLLSTILDGQHIGKHNAAKPEHFAKDYTFLGSIRNPWDWYLSLWSYGCGKQGAFYKAVTSNNPRLTGHGWSSNIYHALFSLANEPFRNVAEWRDCYTNVEDASKFRKWLSMVHNSNYWADYGEGYSRSSINSIAGLMSYRYLSLFCRNWNTIKVEKKLGINDLKRFDRNNCYIDHFIYNENLEQDFIEIVQQCEIEVSLKDRSRIQSSKKTNTSTRKYSASYYYNDTAINLVANREQLIIDKFGYKPPN